jgi:excinuclease ABC subunit C
MPPQIANILKNLPSQPGVYRYYGAGDNVLYVGKAKNLKNRVSQYFQNNKLEGNQRLQTMVAQIERVEYTTVKTEKEALILEANLIYNLQPKYNVLLKDDRSYLYVRISGNTFEVGNPNPPLNSALILGPQLNPCDGSSCYTEDDSLTVTPLEKLPKITLTRRKYDKNSDYFGPYTKKFGIVNVLRVLRTIFPYCENAGAKSDSKNLAKPCHYVQLKQCDGICCGKENPLQYQAKIQQIKKVLAGKTDQAKIWLKNKIREALAVENYQLAGLWRDRINMLDEVIENQHIILPQPQNLDIITLIHETDISGLAIASVFIQNIREGKIINLNNFIMSGTQDQIEEESFEREIIRNNTIVEGEIPLSSGGSEAERVSNAIETKTQKINPDISIQTFIQTFLVNYYSEQSYKPEILLQVYENTV